MLAGHEDREMLQKILLAMGVAGVDISIIRSLSLIWSRILTLKIVDGKDSLL